MITYLPFSLLRFIRMRIITHSDAIVKKAAKYFLPFYKFLVLFLTVGRRKRLFPLAVCGAMPAAALFALVAALPLPFGAVGARAVVPLPFGAVGARTVVPAAAASAAV